MKRIQRMRTKGWRMPTNTVYVGRPTKWGNPFKESETVKIDQVLRQYRSYILCKVARGELDLSWLNGKDLACWCRLDQGCHADILMELCGGK